MGKEQSRPAGIYLYRFYDYPIALTFFILFMYLSIAWSDGTIIEGLKTATKPLRLILIPMIVLITSLKYNDIPKVITAFLLGMLVSEILSYGIFFEFTSKIH